jgi:hypothetical protein
LKYFLVERHVQLYPCCPEQFPDVRFYIGVQRRSLFFVLSLIFPCVVICAVATMAFILPPESGEKIALTITVLLSLAVFLLLVFEFMPYSDRFPYIGQYYYV